MEDSGILASLWSIILCNQSLTLFAGRSRERHFACVDLRRLRLLSFDIVDFSCFSLFGHVFFFLKSIKSVRGRGLRLKICLIITYKLPLGELSA